MRIVHRAGCSARTRRHLQGREIIQVCAAEMPAEQVGETGDWLRLRGKEYGATTGRPRRCGWFDAVAAAWAARLAGFTKLALTKLDVLDGLSRIPFCVAYRDGERVLETVAATAVMARVRPIYDELPGWSGETAAARTVDDLPAEARAYVAAIEQRVGVPIRLISVGPQRDAAIARVA